MLGGRDACKGDECSKLLTVDINNVSYTIGDSGGPMWVEENGQAVLIGLVSRGRNCAFQNTPGIYTR